MQASSEFKTDANGTVIQRRHRLNEYEIPEAIEALRLRLWYHLEYRDSLLDAVAAFKAYFRLTTHCCNKPKYPDPITWDLISKFLGAPPYEVIPLLKEVLA